MKLLAKESGYSGTVSYLPSLAVRVQWRIQDFPKGMPTPKGAPTYYLTNFYRKLHVNEEILAQGGRVHCAP